MPILDDRRTYFAAQNEAYTNLKATSMRMTTAPRSIVAIDARNSVASIPTRIPGPDWIPEPENQTRMEELTREIPVVLSCWNVWRGRAYSVAAALLDAGFDLKEKHGGVEAWRSLTLSINESGEGG